MTTAEHSPVVIVGAGPVGVTAALLLARRGVRSVLLERHRDVYPLPRAVAVDDEVRRILQAAGVHEEFDRVARPSKGLRLLNSEHRVVTEFALSAHGRHGFPQSSMFDQPELERLLRAELARRPECDLRGGVDVVAVDQEPGCPVRVSYRSVDGGPTEVVSADAVLGCDGAGGRTRDAIGATWEDLRFEEEWTVVDVRTDAAVRCWEGVDQVCDPRRPSTFMRVGEDRYRWEFRLDPAVEPDVRDLVAPWVRPAPDERFEVVRRARYTFRARLADRWRHGRVFLLGDAAHQTPPFIGQGLCAGMRDAANLAWKLALVLRDAADERLLDTYEAERKPHARRMIRLAVATGWAMTGGQDWAAALRRVAAAAVWRVPGVVDLLLQAREPTLTPGPLTAGGRLRGTQCPQPRLRHDGRESLLDEVLGDSFAVLTDGTPLTPSSNALATALDAPVLDVSRVDDGGTLTRWLAGGRANAVVLRPDRVVLDSVPAGSGRFTTADAWAPLLRTGRRKPEVRR